MAIQVNTRLLPFLRISPVHNRRQKADAKTYPLEYRRDNEQAYLACEREKWLVTDKAGNSHDGRRSDD